MRPREGAGELGWAAVVGLAYLTLLLATVGELGYARDEGFYFVAARSYQSWFSLLAHDPAGALRDVDLHWRINSEHPALVKSVFALSHQLLYERWGLVAVEGTSFRFGGMLLSSLGVGLVYLWGARAIGRLGGVVAAVSLAMMPRFFFHAHLACFDAPVVAMWTLAAYAYWRASERGGKWRVLGVGIAFGLALNTKHNAWFLPIVCAGHALSMVALASPPHRRRRLRRGIATLLSMAIVGPLLFYVTWPWIWNDTFARLEGYARFHLDHVYYNMEYLGSNYFEPPMPRSYAFVMTAATVPMVTLAAFAVGVVVRGRRVLARFRFRVSEGEVSATVLWMLAMVVQYGAWLRPGTPIFGGTKHWMTAYPFLVLFAAAAVASLARAASRSSPGKGPRWAAVSFVTVMSVAPPVVEALAAHPWGLSHYTPLVGGPAGGASLGLNRGFWGYSTGAISEEINRSAPPGARIFIHDTALAAWQMLGADGKIREDLSVARSAAGADLAIYHQEMHMQGVEYQIWVAFGTTAPIHVEGLQGVPVVWLYSEEEP